MFEVVEKLEPGLESMQGWLKRSYKSSPLRILGFLYRQVLGKLEMRSMAMLLVDLGLGGGKVHELGDPVYIISSLLEVGYTDLNGCWVRCLRRSQVHGLGGKGFL